MAGTEIKEVTRKNYEREYARMVKEAKSIRAYGDEPEHIIVNATDLVKDLFDNHKSLKQSTLYMRRNALIYKLTSLPQNEDAANALAKLYSPEYKFNLKDIAGVGHINSRKPGRMIPFDDYELLMKKLFHMGKWGQATQYFLAAGCASGARPIEWIQAKWVDKDNCILRLQSAKVKTANAWDRVPPMLFTEPDSDNVLANAIDTRRLSVDEIERLDFERRLASAPNLLFEDKTELRQHRFVDGFDLFRDVRIESVSSFLVQQHMNSIRHFFDTIDPLFDSETMPIELKKEYYDRIYFDRCRNTIFRACKELFPITDPTQPPIIYSLVDARSTFASNRKAIQGLAKTAEELGHTLTTSKTNYAPMRDAWAKYRRTGQNSDSQTSISASDINAPPQLAPSSNNATA